MAQMQPYPSQLAMLPGFISHEPVTLEVKEKSLSLSGDSFDICILHPDGRREPKFKVQGDVMSLSGRKHVSDMQGNPLFDIRKEHFTIHTTYYAQDASGKKILEVRSKFSIGSSEAIASLTTLEGNLEVLRMKGDFFSRSAAITNKATKFPVANIARQFGGNIGRELIAGKQSYLVNIAPNVDPALIVAMCIALDEKNEKGK